MRYELPTFFLNFIVCFFKVDHISFPRSPNSQYRRLRKSLGFVSLKKLSKYQRGPFGLSGERTDMAMGRARVVASKEINGSQWSEFFFSTLLNTEF